MKHFLPILFFIGLLFGQDTLRTVSGQKTAKSQGIAISFNPNFSNLLAGSPSLVDPTFYYVFKKGNISLEPAIGFMGVNEENDYSKRKSSIMTIGLGLLMHKSDTTGLSPYYGLRFTRITVSQEVNYDDDYFMESDSDSESALSIAPVYGLEYYVNKHFSMPLVLETPTRNFSCGA